MTNFLLADTFQDSLTKLNNKEQKAVKLTVFDLQQNLVTPRLQFHRIDGSKDSNFWSVRVNRDIRLIIHKSKSSFLVAYVDHHDEAYKWALRRRIEKHPHTGVAQIVEVRERVEEITIPKSVTDECSSTANNSETPSKSKSALFVMLSNEDILNVGVPSEWVEDIRNATEDSFIDLAQHIPYEAAEALMDYAGTGTLKMPRQARPGSDPFLHPDAQRRFRAFDDQSDLEKAFKFPLDKWALYLHPDQKLVVDENFAGPARISGAAGTGKTVVALHRAAHLLRKNPEARLLLTTFSSPLSNTLKYKLNMLLHGEANIDQRVSILPFYGVASELFALANGYTPRIAEREHVTRALNKAAEEIKLEGFSERFLYSEFQGVADTWQVDSLEAYARVPRLGLKNQLGKSQLKVLWPVFKRTWEILSSQHRYTLATICGEVTANYRKRLEKPFSHIIVDESQDLGVPELKMMAAIKSDEQNSLFFAGDLGQRIFTEPFSWLRLGIDVRGRTRLLKVNYRTSYQIRCTADNLLPTVIQDVDGIKEDRSNTVSLFNGDAPVISIHPSEEEEIRFVASSIRDALHEGLLPEEIGVFVRSSNELFRVRKAVEKAQQATVQLSGKVEERVGRVVIGTMHLAKGLEFRLTIVMACDEDILPDHERLHTAADLVELDEFFDTERNLFYVAITRAREKLIVSGVSPASEFMADLKGDS